MKKEKVIKNLLFLFFSSFLVISCSSNNKIIDFDISDLPKSKKTKPTIKNNEELIQPENNNFIKDLNNFQSKDVLLSKYKLGKKDPFSKGDNQLPLVSNFKLTGFLNTEIEKYVFVTYLGNKGTISENSVGGLNTNLLPKGAKVININIEKKQLKIRFNKEDFIFEL